MRKSIIAIAFTSEYEKIYRLEEFFYTQMGKSLPLDGSL
jgi:hypothetical protein